MSSHERDDGPEDQEDGPGDGLTRRRFLEGAALAAGAVAVGVGCGDDASPGGPRPVADAGPYDEVPPGSAAVGVSGHAELETRVRRAIVAAGGLDAIGPGDTVFIKPNAVHSLTLDNPAIVTDPAVLAIVVRIVRERGPARIVVGDRSARPFRSQAILNATGLAQAALDAGADEVYAAPRPAEDPDAWVLLQPEGFEDTWAEQGGILAMRRIVEADHFINLPVCKDHRWAVYSLTMKNLIGAVGDDSRDAMHYVAAEPDRLSRDIAVLNQMFSPLLNVIDAGFALLNGGPEGIGTDAVRSEPGLVIASRDRIAADVTAVSLIQHGLASAEVPEPDAAHAFLTGSGAWELPQVVHGIARGLGIASPDRLVLRFEEVEPALVAAIESRARGA